MKKVELHCHLDGSLPLPFIARLGAAMGLDLPEGEELASMVQVPRDNDSLDAYLKCFDLPLLLLKQRGSIRNAVIDVLEDAARENVIYTELRFAPLPLESSDYSCRDMIEDAIDGLKEGYRRYGVQGNMILCGMRHVSPEENMKILRVGRDYLGEGVCAVDMAGSEAMFPILLQSDFFREARRIDMPFTIHAGECGDPDSVRNALELGASRLGHGIAIWKDPELMKICRDRRIPLEMCPISNMQTKAASSVQEYPFPLFMKEGLLVTINTDNRQTSNTTLEQEFEFLQDNYNITPADMNHLTESAVEAAFASDQVKNDLLRQLKD